MIPIVIIVFLLFVFRSWFLSPILQTLSAGDWPYLWLEQIKEFIWYPEARFLWLAPYYQVVTKFFVEILGIHWHLVERLLLFWPWIVISFFSAKKFTHSVLGGLMYTTNTYALMLVGGGQMGVAMAYALAPLVLVQKWFLPVQVMFDPRIALLTLLVALRKNPKRLVIPVLIAVVLHTYWWLPLIKNPSILSTQFQEATSGAVQYLSFASFSNSLSLLHPNWPENIFGKVYFQRPEFLVIPIIAFAALLFKSKRYFVLLALIGAFFAKGTNEPFGGLYVWLFNNIPGFSLFRDPTKFYLFIALAYSVLIPYTLKKLNKKFFVFIFLIFWAVTIREAINGKLTGTFKPLEVPVEYVKLKDASVAWYPKKSRFSFSGFDYYSLENVRYVAVPVDVRGEIFVTDRMYDESKRIDAIAFIATMSGLRRVDEYKELAVFEVIR